MKIGWLANSFDPIGGAEMTDATMIREGEKKHTIIKITPKNNIPKADLYIFSNISKFKEEKILEAIAWKAPYKTPHINYFHDYEMALMEAHPEIIGNAELNIFLSPLHKDTMMKYVNCVIPKNLCIPSPVSPKQFYDMKQQRNEHLYAGHCLPHKGTVALEKWLEEDKERTLYHYGNGKINHPRAMNYKTEPYKKMNELYNTFKHFVFFPQWNEPFGRTVAEAYLTGCKMNVDVNKIGFYSYDWDYSNKKQIAKYLENAPKMFWMAVSHYKLYEFAKKIKGMLWQK